MSEQDTMAVLAAVLADPAAAAQRLKDMNAARSALERAKLDNDARKEELKKTEADANKVYKEASEARLAAARDLKDAEAQRKSNQSLLDKISNREAEINAREEKVTSTEKKQKRTQGPPRPHAEGARRTRAGPDRARGRGEGKERGAQRKTETASRYSSLTERS